MIKTLMGTHSTSEMVKVHGMPCAIPHSNSSSLLYIEPAQRKIKMFLVKYKLYWPDIE
jgi:hypothetical protein